MLTFFVIFSQIVTMALGIYILSKDQLNVKFVAIMMLAGLVLGYPLYIILGTIGIFFLLLFFFICLFLQTKKIAVSLIIPFVMIIIVILGEYISQLLGILILNEPLEILRENEGFTVITVIASSLISVFLCRLARYIFIKWKIKNRFDRRYISLIVSFLSLTVILFYFSILIVQQKGFTDESIRLSLLLFLLYTGLLFIVLVIMIRTTSKNIQIESERIQYKQLQRYVEELEVQHKEIRNFRHDYMNILLTMSGYVNQKDTDGLIHYLVEEIFPTGEKFQSDDYQLGMLSKLHIPEVKSIVSSKIIQAQGLNIHIIVDIPSPINYLNMNILNLCRSLGIILDNAIEESQLCDDPILKIAFLQKENQQLIIVKNSCRKSLPTTRQMFQDGFSTKGKNRGLGLSILKEIIDESKEITLETSIEEDGFIQKMSIVH